MQQIRRMGCDVQKATSSAISADPKPLTSSALHYTMVLQGIHVFSNAGLCNAINLETLSCTQHMHSMLMAAVHT